MLDKIPALPGTYLLVFHTDVQNNISVGRLGELELLPGCYVYVGSAFGPGGLRARLRHHVGISSRPHWHLDYLRPHLSLREIWFSTDNKRHEHAWADSMVYTMQMAIPMPGLGASDCKCESHFFYSTAMLDNNRLQQALHDKQKSKTLEMVKLT